MGPARTPLASGQLHAGSGRLTYARRAIGLSVILDTTRREFYSEPMFQGHSAKNAAPWPLCGIRGDATWWPGMILLTRYYHNGSVFNKRSEKEILVSSMVGAE